MVTSDGIDFSVSFCEHRDLKQNTLKPLIEHNTQHGTLYSRQLKAIVYCQSSLDINRPVCWTDVLLFLAVWLICANLIAAALNRGALYAFT